MYISQFEIKQRDALYLASSNTTQQLCLPPACNVDSLVAFGTPCASSTAPPKCIHSAIVKQLIATQQTEVRCYVDGSQSLYLIPSRMNPSRRAVATS
jgi:hypothetical protein